MSDEQVIQVEVAYATLADQTILKTKVAASSNVRDAIEKSGILNLHPEIDIDKNKVGIFSKLCSLDTKLRAGDRVEIYRPLLIDPKESRKQRAVKKNN